VGRVTLERRNPLPVGRYWVDATAPKAVELTGYFAANASRIHVEVTEGAGDDVVFFIFSVSQPVPWFAENFGFPTVAGAGVHSKADAVQSPDLPPSAAETAEGLLHKAGAAVELVGIGIGLLIILKVLEAARKK